MAETVTGLPALALIQAWLSGTSGPFWPNVGVLFMATTWPFPMTACRTYFSGANGPPKPPPPNRWCSDVATSCRWLIWASAWSSR